jgi:hypothetical protein
MDHEVTTALMGRLREIVSREPWDQDDLAEWANEFLFAYDDGGMGDQFEQERRRQEQQVTQLKRHFIPYQHDPALPPLPDSPDGQLHGIGFIYDEDRDDRVLVAIDRLKDRPGLVALAEHEGGLDIYSRLPVGQSSMVVCGDQWTVTEFLPYRGRRTEATPRFIRDCVAQVLGQKS